MVTDARQPGARVTLVLGGTRSGKSRIAESIAAELARLHPPPDGHPSVTYVATARLDPNDPSHRARIDAHRRRRPESWSTLECAYVDVLPEHLTHTDGVVVVDSLGTWLTLDEHLEPDHGCLVEALGSRRGPTVIVSEEVGLAIHPTTELGRRYVDALGELNQRISEVADRVLFVAAGRVLELDRWEIR